MAISSSGSVVNALPGVFVLSAGNGGMDGTGTATMVVVAAGATLDVGVEGEATPAAITFTALANALNGAINFIGGNNTITALTSAGGAITVTGDGKLTIDSLAGVTALSRFTIGSGSTLSFGPDVSLGALDLVDFAGSTGTLILDGQGLSLNLLSGMTNFAPGAQLTITGADYDPAKSFYNAATGTLNLVTDSGTDQTIRLAGEPGSFAGEYFHIDDTSAGATISLSTDAEGGFAACYVRGTKVLTDTGEAAVEDLSIGDRLVTLSGRARTLRWIGRRAYGGRFLARSPAMQPVLIRQGALDGSLPIRDLMVSPLHAMYLDGVLVPAHCLLNGLSITQVTRETVDYFHLELDSHDVILAEGAPSETFIDDDSRGMFHNAHTYAELYPNAGAAQALYCAPRVESGFQLEAIRRRLAAQARSGWRAAG